MASPQLDAALNDFSLGEVDPTAKRDAGPIVTTGARQMSNFRILNTHKIANRPGRSALFSETGRVDEITMGTAENFFLAFGPNYLRVYNSSGARVFNSTVKGDGFTPIPWTGNYGVITWAIANFSIYICYFDGVNPNVPQVLTWDGASQTSTWTLSTYAETVTPGGQKRTIFYRIAAPGITLAPSAISGSVTLTFSADVLSGGMIGTRLRYCGRQILITGATSGTVGAGTVEEPLPQGVVLSLIGDPTLSFAIGDVVEGATSGAEGIVTAVVGPSTNQITVQLLASTTPMFVANEKIAGPGGNSQIINTGTPVAITTPQAVSTWDQEIMNAFWGYPISVFYDQTRLGFCNFPAVPSGISWSAVGLPDDLYVDSGPDNAIFELAPKRCRVLYVVGGMEGSEFFFCDSAIYYTLINASNPLKPGSVAFNQLSAWGAMPFVQPRAAEQTIVYMKAGGLQVGAVQVPGYYARPYIIDTISEFHEHLFAASPAVAIAIPSAAAQFEELYCYILLANGSLVVGKYNMRQGLIEPGQDGKPRVGWTPWSSAGATFWASALNSDVIFTTTYTVPGTNSFTVVEKSDNTQYLDAAILVNGAPAALAPPAGKGPLWFVAGGSVFLIDNGTRFMGMYQVDANGWIIPQNQGGENLASTNLIAGQMWTATYEPFVPHAPAGENQRQRMRRRRIPRAAASVQNSSGFVIGTRRIPAYFVGDDATQPAPLREDTYFTRPRGSAYDPRIALLKDTPGPFVLLEFGIEATT